MLFTKISRYAFKALFVPTITVFGFLCLSSPELNTNAYDKEDFVSSEELTESNILRLVFTNSIIEISIKDDCIVLKKLDSSHNEIWIKEIIQEEGYSAEQFIPINDYGFISINKYIGNDTVLNELNTHKLVAFSMDGDIILEEEATEITEEYFNQFARDVFLIPDENVDNQEDLDNELSQDELYKKALELLQKADTSLLESDINNAKNIIDRITDKTKREELLATLNEISNKSIEEELNNPFFDKEDIDSSNSYTGASYINLSVDTNSVTFDALNVSSDTTLNRAVTLEVSSSLPYDINVIIEGDITSNTNPTNLNKNVFSVKESSSSDFAMFDDTGIVPILSNHPPGDAISHGIDIRLNTSANVIRDVYRAVFKVEAITK